MKISWQKGPQIALDRNNHIYGFYFIFHHAEIFRTVFRVLRVIFWSRGTDLDEYYNSHLLPRRVYKTQTFDFTPDTVGDQFTIHTEVR